MKYVHIDDKYSWIEVNTQANFGDHVTGLFVTWFIKRAARTNHKFSMRTRNVAIENYQILKYGNLKVKNMSRILFAWLRECTHPSVLHTLRCFLLAHNRSCVSVINVGTEFIKRANLWLRM